MVKLRPEEVEMRYELGIATLIMATLYCFRVVGGMNDDIVLYKFLVVLVSSMVLLMVARYITGFSRKKFFSAENLWVSFCFSFFGVPLAVLIYFFIIKLLFV